MQITFEELTQKPLDEENKHYLEWRHQHFPNADSTILSLVRSANKSLSDIRREILYAEQNNTLIGDDVDSLENDCSVLSLDESIAKYFESWRAHDEFALSTVFEIPEILNSPERLLETLSVFIENDKLVRHYVSFNLPKILEDLHARILSVTGVNFIPLIDSFEIHLMQEAYLALGNKEYLRDFANRYTYGDLSFADQEVRRLCKTTSADILGKIEATKAKKREACVSVFKKIQLQSNEKVENLIHRYMRLSYWAGFEEPRKRYCIEAGIVDYLFRELLFQKVKYKNPILKDASFCLQIDQLLYSNIIGNVMNS